MFELFDRLLWEIGWNIKVVISQEEVWIRLFNEAFNLLLEKFLINGSEITVLFEYFSPEEFESRVLGHGLIIINR